MGLNNDLNCSFPAYNPNPEALGMLQGMADAVWASGADLALGFDSYGASSNTRNLVVACESQSRDVELRATLSDLEKLLEEEPSDGAFDQRLPPA